MKVSGLDNLLTGTFFVDPSNTTSAYNVDVSNN